MITFSGTSYLGLDQHPVFIQLVQEGLQHYGTHYGGSRRSPLAPDIFQKVERQIAEWTKAPAVLLLSSGTAAAQLAIRHLVQEGNRLHFSPMAHPALHWPGGERYPDWQNWSRGLSFANNACLTDSVDPLNIIQPHWTKFLTGGDGTLVVDDSHLIGHHGLRAAGSWEHLQSLWPGKLLLTASLGKALCIPAGVLLGEQKTLDAIRKLPQFGGASPPTPAFLYAWLKAKELLLQQRQRLQSNLAFIHQLIGKDERFQTLNGFPVIGLKEHHWAAALLQQNIQVSAFRYPTEQDKLYSRIVITASHTRKELSYLRKCLQVLMA